jgi:hypothetical protein
MRFFAIAAALIACASANDMIFLADEEEPAKEEAAVDAAYKAYLETHKHHATELKQVCAAEETAIADASEPTAALYGKAIKCFKDKRLLAQGRTAVKDSETVIAGTEGASDALKACKTTWDATSKRVADTDAYFRCVVQNKGANAAYPSWELDKIKAKVPEAAVTKGVEYCKITKGKFEAEKTHENAVKLASCYRGVFKGGSATILIVVVLVLAIAIAVGVYFYNKSQTPNKDDDFRAPEAEVIEE